MDIFFIFCVRFYTISAVFSILYELSLNLIEVSWRFSSYGVLLDNLVSHILDTFNLNKALLVTIILCRRHW